MHTRILNRVRNASIASVVVILLAAGCVRDQEVKDPQPSPAKVEGVDAVLPARHEMLEPSARIPAGFTTSALVEVFGNFHTAGIVVGLAKGADSATEIGGMRAYINNAGDWARVQDPVQVGKFPWFATSLFWLKPASTYQVKVEVLDKAGLISGTWYGEGTTRAEPVLAEAAVNRYVAPTGDDAGPGTFEHPLRTLARAFALVEGGETVVVRGGIYFEGQLEFAHNGKAGAPIVVRAFQGEAPVLSGANPEALAPSAWKDEGGGIFSHPSSAGFANLCVEDLDTGRIIRMFTVPSLMDLQARRVPEAPDVPSQLFAETGVDGGAFFDGTRVYMAPPAGLKNFRVHLSHQVLGIDLTGKSHIQIEGLVLQFYGVNQPSTAMIAQDASDVLIQNCDFLYDDCQIYVKGQTHRLTVQDCSFVDGMLDWPFGYMKMSGASAPYEGGAINVDANYSGRGLVIRRNHVAGLFDGMHLTPWLKDEARTQETDFYENTMDGCIDDFIELDGYARNVRVFDNVMSRSLSGISVAQALDGPTYIAYNVLADCGMVAAAWREGNFGYPFKTNGGPEMEVGSGEIFFYHNTSYTLDPESRAMLVKIAIWRRLTFRNNIWCGQRVGAESCRKELSPMDFDYDNLFVTDTNAPLVLMEYHDRTDGLHAVRQRFGWLRHGISAEPRLRDVAAGDYRLRDDSPCIDAGTVVPGINEARKRGTAPDLGAYEAR